MTGLLRTQDCIKRFNPGHSVLSQPAIPRSPTVSPERDNLPGDEIVRQAARSRSRSTDVG
jgi:hypothetical protein